MRLPGWRPSTGTSIREKGAPQIGSVGRVIPATQKLITTEPVEAIYRAGMAEARSNQAMLSSIAGIGKAVQKGIESDDLFQGKLAEQEYRQKLALYSAELKTNAYRTNPETGDPNWATMTEDFDAYAKALSNEMYQDAAWRRTVKADQSWQLYTNQTRDTLRLDAFEAQESFRIERVNNAFELGLSNSQSMSEATDFANVAVQAGANPDIVAEKLARFETQQWIDQEIRAIHNPNIEPAYYGAAARRALDGVAQYEGMTGQQRDALIKDYEGAAIERHLTQLRSLAWGRHGARTEPDLRSAYEYRNFLNSVTDYEAAGFLNAESLQRAINKLDGEIANLEAGRDHAKRLQIEEAQKAITSGLLAGDSATMAFETLTTAQENEAYNTHTAPGVVTNFRSQRSVAVGDLEVPGKVAWYMNVQSGAVDPIAAATSINFYRQGQIPDMEVGFIQGDIQSGSTETQVAAAEHIAFIARQNPEALKDLDEITQLKAELINWHTANGGTWTSELGVPFMEAVDKYASMPDTEKKTYLNGLDNVRKDIGYKSFAEEMGEVAERIGIEDFEKKGLHNAAAVYEKKLQDFYVMTNGNYRVASAAALRHTLASFKFDPLTGAYRNDSPMHTENITPDSYEAQTQMQLDEINKDRIADGQKELSLEDVAHRKLPTGPEERDEWLLVYKEDGSVVERADKESDPLAPVDGYAVSFHGTHPDELFRMEKEAQADFRNNNINTIDRLLLGNSQVTLHPPLTGGGAQVPEPEYIDEMGEIIIETPESTAPPKKVSRIGGGFIADVDEELYDVQTAYDETALKQDKTTLYYENFRTLQEVVEDEPGSQAEKDVAIHQYLDEDGHERYDEFNVQIPAPVMTKEEARIVRDGLDAEAEASSGAVIEGEVIPAPRPQETVTPDYGEPSASISQTPEMLAMTKEYEGARRKMYLDSVGVPTIGIGFNLDKPGARERIEDLGLDYEAVRSGRKMISDKQMLILFKEDMATAEADARALFPNFDELPQEKQMVLVDMAFNLGRTKLSEFRQFRNAISEKDYQRAADSMRNSLWFQQVKNRGYRNVSLMMS